MKCRRGSAVVMCIVLVTAATTVLVANVGLTGAGVRMEVTAERAKAAACAFDGAVAQVVDDFANDNLTFGAPRVVVIGDVTCNVTATDNSTNTQKTIRVDGQMTVKGYTVSITRMVGARHDPSPFYYAVATTGTLNCHGLLLTGNNGRDGDVFASGNIQLYNSPDVVNGDLECAGPTVRDLNTTVTGSTITRAKDLTFPSPNPFDYVYAWSDWFDSRWMWGYTFGSPGTYYPLVYSPFDLSIQGQFAGKGTIFVNGDVTVTDDMSYVDDCSEVAIIATGDITFNPGVDHVVGYFYTCHNMNFNNGSGLTVTRGGLIAGNIFWNGTLNVTHDRNLWSNLSEGRKLRLPGLWP